MKNFTKKLALLLVFAMVLGVVAPGRVAKAADPVYAFTFNFYDEVFIVKRENSEISDFEYAQYVGDTAPTADNMKAIKDKDWVTFDGEIPKTDDDDLNEADMSWFNKKKASYVVVRYWNATTNAYEYAASGKIEAQADALKVLYSDKNEAAKTNKAPAYTSDKAIGSEATGFFVFYTGKGDNMKVVTPSSVYWRVDGSYKYNRVMSPVGGQITLSGENSKFVSKIAKYIAKGATFYFVEARIANTLNTDGWAPKETKFKLSGQKNAPTVKLGIDHVVPLKAGQEYRIVDTSAPKTRSAWVNVDTAHGEKDAKGKVKVGKILLEDLVVTTAGITVADKKISADFITSAGKLNPTQLAAGKVKLQVRTAATSKGVASKIYSVVVSQKAIGTAASTASVNGTAGADLSVSYKKPYDATSGLVIKNNNTTDDYEVCFLTSGASVTPTAKWTAVKAGRSVEVKRLETSDKKAYTNFAVRKVGDKKNGILSSNFHAYEIKNVTVVKQSITENANGTITGVSGAAVKVTSDGAVKVTIPKSEVSGAAIKDKSFDVAVVGVTDPGTLKWKAKGASTSFKLDVPTYSKDAKKVTFKIKEIKANATGNSGDYTCEVEGLKFTVNIAIGN